MKWSSKEDAQKAHIDNYRSDNVKKGYGSPLQPHFHRVMFISANENDVRLDQKQGKLHGLPEGTGINGVVERISPGSYVLDVGCNAGALDIPLIKKGCHVKGIDLVEDLVERAKKNGVFAQVGEAEDLSMFDNDKFDVVICTEVLEHLYDPTLALKEAYRVLKKGGLYLATVPAFGGVMSNDDFLGDYHQQNFTFEMLDTLFYSVFERDSVGHIMIP